jgi:hypothetical protein
MSSIYLRGGGSRRIVSTPRLKGTARGFIHDQGMDLSYDAIKRTTDIIDTNTIYCGGVSFFVLYNANTVFDPVSSNVYSCVSLLLSV